MSYTSNSRQFQQTPRSKAIFFSRAFSHEFYAKSLFRNILPIKPLDGIFCDELFFIALCFQYFANQNGRGYRGEQLAHLSAEGRFSRRRTVAGLCPEPRFYRNLLFAIGTLVYGEGFAKTQERVWPPDRILETDGPFQYPGRERDSLTENLFAASGFGSPARQGDLFCSLAAQRVVEAQSLQPQGTRLFLSIPTQHISVCSPQARN